MKVAINNYLKEKEKNIKTIHEKIWDYAEVGFEEMKSVALYEDLLKQEGFNVTTGVAGMPTAFVATYGEGKPVIGILAEYDALPNLSQEAGVAKESPVEKDGNGHGCGHNSLGAASFAAALAVKEYLKEHEMEGTIKLFGCPSEEKDNGKTFMAREGVFDDVDAAFTWHPMDQNAVWGVSSLANISVVFHFKGKTAHAAAAPHLGRSALDSVEIMNVGVNYLREHIVPDARIHYAYLDAGGTAPNVVQGTASAHYFVRAPKVQQAMEIFERLKDIAKGAALINGTTSSFEILTGLSEYIPNPTLSKILQESMEEYGVPNFTDEEYQIAKSFFETLSEKEKQEIKVNLTKKYGEEKANTIVERPLSTQIEPLQLLPIAMPGSTDVGDVSYVTPTAQLLMATAAIGTPLHTWQMTGQGKTSVAYKGVEAAAGAMALASLKVMKNPELAVQAREELNKETDGKYTCPIPADVHPNITRGN